METAEEVLGPTGGSLEANVTFLCPPVTISQRIVPYPRQSPQAESELPPAPRPGDFSASRGPALVRRVPRGTRGAPARLARAPPAIGAGQGVAWQSLETAEDVSGPTGGAVRANV